MLAPQTRQAVTAGWARRLGLDAEQLAAHAGTLVTPLAIDYWGILCVRIGAANIVAAPAALLERISNLAATMAPATLLEPEAWAGALGPLAERVVGPAWIGYADSTIFRPAHPQATHLLGPSETPALERLLATATPLEREHSAIHPDRPPIFGCFAGSELAAAATLIEWDAGMRNVGVLTSPQQRGSGYGRAAVSVATGYGLSQGFILMYQTLAANSPAIALATSLGYASLVATLAIRLRQPLPAQEERQ